MSDVQILKNNLQNLSDALYANCDPSRVRYFHLNSVNNFIKHLSDVRLPEDQEWIYITLNNYLLTASEMTETIDRKMSAELFARHLQKIADYYSSQHQFSLVISPFYTTTFYFIAFLLVFLFIDKLASLFIIPIFLFHIIRITKKYKTGRVYSLFY